MASLQPKIKDRKNRVSLNWNQLNAVITGVSAIDLPSLAIRTRNDARNFAREYGFDIDDPIAREEIARVHFEAVSFIQKHFLNDAQKDLISQDVRNPDDVLDLLVFSSNYLNKSNVKQMWACAVLKVMHGIFHIDHDSKLMYFDEIRRQIFDSIDKVIVREDGQDYLQDDQTRLPLFKFEKKRNKGRQSVLLKLLQKPSYVASDIYDHLGIRLVFETKAECLFALKLLRRSHLLTVTNIKPNRSRNNLVDLKISKRIFNRFKPLLHRAAGYPSDVFKKIDEELEASYIKRSRDNNPHSSIDFRSIQITARKMIRITNPLYRQLQDLVGYLGDKVELPDHFIPGADNRNISFYFDFEIQLLDQVSYLASLHGPASHEAYKKRQIETASKRVLGLELLKYIEEKTRLAQGG